MNQCLLPNEASGGASRYDYRPVPRPEWVAMSQDSATQAELRYVYLADAVVSARQAADAIMSATRREYAIFSFRLGLIALTAAVVLLGLTFVAATPLIPITAGFLLFGGCLTLARAAERYQRAG